MRTSRNFAVADPRLLRAAQTVGVWRLPRFGFKNIILSYPSYTSHIIPSYTSHIIKSLNKNKNRISVVILFCFKIAQQMEGEGGASKSASAFFILDLNPYN